MVSKYHSNSAPNVPFFLSVLFVFLILLGTSGSVYGQWTPHIIEENAGWISYFEFYDFDNDGDMDAIGAKEFDDEVVYYENLNNVSWKKQILEKSFGPAGVEIADLNNDGKKDLIVAYYGADLVAWYENDGRNPIEWRKDTIDNSYDGPMTVEASDINGDGELDIVCKIYNSGETVWYENNLPDAWTNHLIHNNMPGNGSLQARDMDDDNKPDVLRSYEEGNKVVLFRNNLPDENWSEITIDGNLTKTRCSSFGDIDMDGDLDIIATAHGSNQNELDVAWYENDGSGNTWTKHLVISHLSDAIWINLKDIDNNNSPDIVVSDRDAEMIILLVNNNGGQNWSEYLIENHREGLRGTLSFDMDMDGDLDIVEAREEGDFVWYENPLGTLHAQTLKVSPFSIQSQTDTLEVRAKVSNPENHPGQVYAVIQGDQTQYMDTLQLFDDGMHGDEGSSDNVWGNIRLTKELPEDEYEVDLFTNDSTYGDTLGFAAPGQFINLGPLEFEEYTIHPSFPCMDLIPNPGACLYLKIALKNGSSTATATNIKAEILSLDTMGSFSDIPECSFEEIPAGENRKSEETYILRISKECPEYREIPFEVIISSYDQVCWRDTFSITVIDPTISVKDISASKIRIYPNPTNDLLTIEVDKPDNYTIEITSLNGQLIYEAKMEGSSQQIDLSSFLEGIYLIKVRSNNFIETRKLIKLE